MQARLEAIQPVLGCRSVADSVEFFQRLGFELRFLDNPTDPRYAGVARDGVELHLQWHDADEFSYPVDRPAIRFFVSDVDALYAEFLERGVIPPADSSSSPWAQPGNTPWGTREFHLHDPDRASLQFYRLL